MDKIDGTALGQLLKRVHLRGLIQECVLEVKDGVASVQAVDMSNSVFLYCSEKIDGLDDIQLGLPNLNTLCRFLESTEKVSLKIKEQWITLRRKGHGHLRFLMLEVEQVPTAITQKDAAKKVTKNEGDPIKLSTKLREDYSSYMSLVKSRGIVLRKRKGSITLQSNKSDAEQFSLKVGKCDAAEDISIEVYGEHLAQVFDTIGDGDATLHLADDAPVIIHQGGDNFWALTPLSS